MDDYSYRAASPGEPFTELVPGTHHERVLSLDFLAGSYVAICCFGSSCDPRGQAVIKAVLENKALFDGKNLCFMGITIDPTDQHSGRLPGDTIGLYFRLDSDCKISQRCGAAPLGKVPCGTGYRMTWMIIDPTLRVMATFGIPAAEANSKYVFNYLRRLLEPSSYGACEIPAPVIVLPNVFDHGLCDQLVKLYDNGVSRDSGFMRHNVEVFDRSFKSRRDYLIEDEGIKTSIQKRIAACIVPEIRKLFFMDVTRMERFLVAKYAADENGHFNPHRDNGQRVTAHRRFAVSLALNDDFEGGDLLFPEYNRKPHKIPKGWAIVFPCAILHALERVTRGNRYAFLPFLYDEAGAAIKVDSV
jgi:hypothetical protein